MVSMHLAAVLLSVTGIGETVLLDFHAPWCGPCRSMDATVEQLASAGYPVRRVNIDEQRDLAARFGVQSIPCFVLLVDGREVERVVGATDRRQLEGMFAKARLNPPGGAGDVALAQSPDGVPRPGLLPGLRNRLRQAGNSLARAVPLKLETSAEPFTSAPRAPQPSAAPSHNPVAIEQLLKSSVRLTIEDAAGFSYGSGTIIDSRGPDALVLTCGHVFRDSKGNGKISVELFGPGSPQKLEGKLISYDLKRDVGLVSIHPGTTVAAAHVAPKGYRAAPGDKVVSIGCNNGHTPTAQESHVTGVDKFLGPANVQVAGLPVQGRSGGGLFTPDGLVIGVCNAADPTDHEGLYAAAATIQEELDYARLSAIYDSRPSPSAIASAPTQNRAAAANQPLPAATVPTDLRVVADAASEAIKQLSPQEQATLSELRRRAQGAEVICIVRPLANPTSKSEIIVLDRASPDFLRKLAAERNVQDARHLTSLDVPRPGMSNRQSTAAISAAQATPTAWQPHWRVSH